MSAIRARYSGPSTEGVDLTVELDTGEFRQVHVPQGGLLPAEIDGTAVSTAFRDGLFEQDDWTKQRQTTSEKSSDTTKEA